MEEDVLLGPPVISAQKSMISRMWSGQLWTCDLKIGATSGS
jgi:hypothetical protein